MIKQTHRDQSDKFQHRTLTEFAKLSLQAEPDTTDLPPCCKAFSGKNVALAGGKYWIKARKVFVQELMSKRFLESCPPIRSSSTFACGGIKLGITFSIIFHWRLFRISSQVPYTTLLVNGVQIMRVTKGVVTKRRERKRERWREIVSERTRERDQN